MSATISGWNHLSHYGLVLPSHVFLPLAVASVRLLFITCLIVYTQKVQPKDVL